MACGFAVEAGDVHVHVSGEAKRSREHDDGAETAARRTKRRPRKRGGA